MQTSQLKGRDCQTGFKKHDHMLSTCVCMLSRFSHAWLFVTLWTVARQAPLAMGFSRQEYWSALPCPPLGDLPDPGIYVCKVSTLSFLPRARSIERGKAAVKRTPIPRSGARARPHTSDASFCLHWEHRQSEWASAVTMEILACGPGWLRRLRHRPPCSAQGERKAEAEISQGLLGKGSPWERKRKRLGPVRSGSCSSVVWGSCALRPSGLGASRE